MREICHNCFVGPREDYENLVAREEGWWVVHATKEPYHRRAVGYEGADPEPSHPEYLAARRGRRLILNLIDAPVAVEIPRMIFDTALSFIHEGLLSGARVLIHCDQGVSRSASIGLLYLRCYTNLCPAEDFAEAERIYTQIYPPFNPGKAIRHFLRSHWREYAPGYAAGGAPTTTTHELQTDFKTRRLQA